MKKVLSVVCAFVFVATISSAALAAFGQTAKANEVVKSTGTVAKKKVKKAKKKKSTAKKKVKKAKAEVASTQEAVKTEVSNAEPKVVSVVTSKEPQSSFKPFAIYVDNASRANHYAPSGWMGDYGDLKITQSEKVNPRSGSSCIKITYTAKMAQGAGWCGIYWQHPANNWGQTKGGYNLTGAKKLTFWARGEKGGELIADFKMGGIAGEFSDTDSAGTGPIELTKNWKQYTIDLQGLDLSRIIGGFSFAASVDDNPNGFIIYLDDIIYE